MRAAPSIDAYLAGVPADKRAELERIRALIRAEAPEAVETISYAMPAFRLDGRYLIGFSATKGGCSIYSGRGALHEFADELAPYRLWKGTINYPLDRPLPAELVRSVVRIRLAEFRSPG